MRGGLGGGGKEAKWDGRLFGFGIMGHICIKR